MSKEHRFPYEWRLSDGYPAKGIENHQSTVFDTFVCGGGSSMGLKLAGYHHLGGVEIDPNVADVYKANHSPELLYNMDIRDFNKLDGLPECLFHLDMLTGSPPCSLFSRVGERFKGWGKKKQFKEGQNYQTLDDLVFEYCDTVIKLHPKCFILENVSGIIEANARSYAKRIVEKLISEGGYDVQVFCLNAALMGVPQVRKRVFFVGHRQKYVLPKLHLDFCEPPIAFGKFIEHDAVEPKLSKMQLNLWSQRIPSDKSFGDITMRTENRLSMANCKLFRSDRVLGTLASGTAYVTYEYPRQLTGREILLAGSFPLDYQYKTLSDIRFFVGMAVPPVMMAQISYEIWKQWIRHIND